ncbi:MAG: hypothetical protein EBZ36_16360 [Acidobacteria bacterium]|nr:hypothetical protein [Acidobacteriota bacterium]
MTAIAVFQALYATPQVVWSVAGVELLARTPTGTSLAGFMPVVPMTLISAILMLVVSRFTPKPGAATIGRYFSR